MIQLEKVNFSDHKSLPAVFDIYERSFPDAERRTRHNIIRQIDYNSDYNFFIVLDDDFPVGMAVVWVIEQRFIYIEHLAIEQSRRSRGLGAKAMKLLIDKSPFPIIIEIEKKTDAMTEEEAANCDRRLKFYEKCGFHLCQHEYIQPPYAKNLPEVPMYLMECDGHLTDTDFDSVRDALYRVVYKAK